MARKVVIKQAVKMREPSERTAYEFKTADTFSDIGQALIGYHQLVSEEPIVPEDEVLFWVEIEPDKADICPSAVVKEDGKMYLSIDPGLNEGEDFSTLTLEELVYGRGYECPT